MNAEKKYKFKAEIYKVGINWCVNVPTEITSQLIAEKGKIDIKGKINGYDFIKTLMPVKDASHRLFVNQQMMKGGKTALGNIANFEIEQNNGKVSKEYSKPKLLIEQLDKHNLTTDFENLSASRAKDILKYLSYIKTEETLIKNINKLIMQLKNKDKNIRIP
jgi:ribosomal protein S8